MQAFAGSCNAISFVSVRVELYCIRLSRSTSHESKRVSVHNVAVSIQYGCAVMRHRCCPLGMETIAVREVAGKQKSHSVEQGETAWSIANTHGVSLSEIIQANRAKSEIDWHDLAPGQVVQLPSSCRDYEGGALFSGRVVRLH
jgi:hypothetical protein